MTGGLRSEIRAGIHGGSRGASRGGSEIHGGFGVEPLVSQNSDEFSRRTHVRRIESGDLTQWRERLNISLMLDQP